MSEIANASSVKRPNRRACSQSTSASPSVWNELFNHSADVRQRKLVWRICRQYRDSLALGQEFGCEPNWEWRVLSQTGSTADRAIKLLLARDATNCETVLLLPPNHARSTRRARATVCVSSQPGCGVGCPFCSTGELGYRGNLTAPQIVEQVYHAGVLARQLNRSLRNVVFMGMGEPLHNIEHVFQAVEWLTSERYFGFSPRKITVSTAGVPTHMIRLAECFPRLRIALSLHAADSDLRRRLVPKAVGDMQILREAIREINHLQPSTPVWLEVVLFDKLNDRPDHAQMIIQFCRGLRVEVNLIPYNPAAGSHYFRPATRANRERFASCLRQAGIRTTIRTSFGSNRRAACGQLAADDSECVE